MTEIKKVVYTAKTHTTGGRDGGASRTSDGWFDVKLSLPGGPGIGTNPGFTAKRVGRPSAL